MALIYQAVVPLFSAVEQTTRGVHSVPAAAVSRYQSMIVGWEKQLRGTPCLSPTLYLHPLHPLHLPTQPPLAFLALPYHTRHWPLYDSTATDLEWTAVEDNHGGSFVQRYAFNTTTKFYDRHKVLAEKNRFYHTNQVLPQQTEQLFVAGDGGLRWVVIMGRGRTWTTRQVP